MGQRVSEQCSGPARDTNKQLLYYLEYPLGPLAKISCRLLHPACCNAFVN